MEIAKLSQNDDLLAVIRKCNVNFRQLAWFARQAIQKQSRIDMDDVSEEIDGITQTLVELENVILPQMVNDAVDTKVPVEVAAQIAAVDIPQMVSDEVAAQMTVLPVGSYLMTQTDPAAIYPGTTWQQSDTVTTDGNVVIPLWERTT